MAEIFISYARVDRERAQALAGAFDREGWSTWWDRDIPPGRTFDEVIEEALTAAKCVIVLWSRDSVRSEWVKAEASDAARRRILVPVLVDEVMPPLEFRRIQSAALPKWETPSSNPDWSHLCRSIGTLVGRQSAGASNAAPARVEPSVKTAGPVSKKPGALSVTALMLSCALVVLMAGLGWAVLSRRVESAPTDSPPDSRTRTEAHDALPVPTDHATPEPALPEPVRVDPLVREPAAASKAPPPRVARPGRELPRAIRDPGPDTREGVGRDRSDVSIAISARAAPTVPSLAPVAEQAPEDGSSLPVTVAPPARAYSATSFDVVYTRGVFRESGRLTVSPEGLRYSESGGHSSVDAGCGEVRGVQLPTVIVDGEQRMVELQLRDRVLRFTMAGTAARNQLVSALSQACGTHSR